MSLAWYPFFPGDYATDTQDLSCCEHGCYRLLLDAFWSRGPLTDDLNRLCRLAAGCDPETVRFILETYWTRNADGLWVNKRMDLMRREQGAKHKRRVQAGKKGGTQKSANRKNIAHEAISGALQVTDSQEVSSNARAMLEQCSSNQNQNQNQIEDLTPNGVMSVCTDAAPQKPGTAEAVEVLEYLNTKAGKSYRSRDNTGRLSGHIEQIRQRLAQYGRDEVVRVIDLKCSEWAGDEKMDQYLRPATLFTKRNFENYLGQAEAKVDHGFGYYET